MELPVFVALVIGLILSLYLYMKLVVYTYWKRHGIWQFEYHRVPVGLAWPIFWNRQHLGDFFLDLYLRMRSENRKFAGMYLITSRQLMITDPEHVKHVLATDFSQFRNRLRWSHEDIDPLSLNLLSLPADRWKQIRQKLSPFFTPNKLKMMFPLMQQCGSILEEVMDDICQKNEVIDVKNLVWRFTCTVLGSCVFGYECDALRNPDHIAVKVGKDVFQPNTLEAMKRPFFFLMPEVLRVLRISSNSKFVTEFFLDLVKTQIEHREKNNFYRPDLMQMLIDARQKDEKGRTDGLTINEMASQCWVFFSGGFDTAAIVVTFCLFELTRNLEIQEKLRAEILEVLERHNGEFSYEAVLEMKYVEKVLKETMRKYPPLPFLNRECTKDFTFPNTNISVRKGDGIVISLLGIQRDPEYYPNPDKFDPERFSDDEQITPYTFMPFGEGPRNCIAGRMGMLQGMYTIALLVSKYKFTLNEKTKLPLKMAPNTFTISVDGGIWTHVKKAS